VEVCGEIPLVHRVVQRLHPAIFRRRRRRRRFSTTADEAHTLAVAELPLVGAPEIAGARRHESNVLGVVAGQMCAQILLPYAFEAIMCFVELDVVAKLLAVGRYGNNARRMSIARAVDYELLEIVHRVAKLEFRTMSLPVEAHCFAVVVTRRHCWRCNTIRRRDGDMNAAIKKLCVREVDYFFPIACLTLRESVGRVPNELDCAASDGRHLSFATSISQCV